MHTIIIENLNKQEVKVFNEEKPLLFFIQQIPLDWMHACGGKGRCTTCRVRLVDGHAHAAPLTSFEQRFRDKGELLEDERLACQLSVKGDMSVKVPEACKLPHLRYSD